MKNSMDSTRNSVEQEETSIMMATESRLTEWTNEKHCLFLKSMESTFVNQLHKSIDVFGWHSHKNGSSGSKSSKHKLTSIRASLGQFKVLRDGGWSKIDFRKDELEVDQEEESKAPLANPLIQHHEISQISCPKAHIATSENQYRRCNFQLWRQDSIGSNTEVTGQNFNDEAFEEEKSYKMQNMKRTRSSTDILSSNDQVVPSDNIVQVDNVSEPHFCLPPKD
ncbi:hypothetical protein CDL12_10899 [Handroanthus impetiginosus]|uniref:Uncharacterized protein n=1 Tax=Handroanthus impetiginosus TaxID=429701 RepID=A0A2G9HG05_9LAMI|nr:hypothetical protein CDL12_10899 [Handroanthus impetiginosus]